MLCPDHRFKFKALELNRKILESAEDLKKPVVKEPTVPKGFELQIEKRLQERQTSQKPSEGEDKPHTFKAQPLLKKMLEGVVVSLNPAASSSMSDTRVYPTTGLVLFFRENMKLLQLFPCMKVVKSTSSCQQGLPEKQVLHPTVPESPAFTLKKRVRVDRKMEEVRTHLVVLNSVLLSFFPSLL